MKVVEKIIEQRVETTTIAVLAEADPKPPRVRPRLTAAPKVRQLLWCDFPEDAHLPEFWKRRPVLVVSYRNTLSGAVTVIPCSSQDQKLNVWAVEMGTTIDGRGSWAICDKPTTVAVSRLSPPKGPIPRVPEDEFHGAGPDVTMATPAP